MIGLLSQVQEPIDRHALVTRHNVTLSAFNGDRPIQVGNGQFAFGMDVTGLQSFASFNTMSHWGWNSSPLPPGQKVEDYRMQIVETHGRPVPYPLADPKHPELSQWMTGNPHAINLGRIGLKIVKRDGSIAEVADLKNVRQTLDLWSGIVTSRFDVEGRPVTVTTACHPKLDAVAAKIESPLVKSGRLCVFLNCPGDDGRQFANFVGDWGRSGGYELLPTKSDRRADFVQRLRDLSVHVGLSWSGKAAIHGPGTPLRIKIIKAEYGAEDKWADVSKIARRAVQDGRLELHVDNRLAGDPAPKIGKSLKLTYEVGGKTLTAEAGENDDLLIDPSEHLRGFTLQPRSGNSGSLSFLCVYSPSKVLEQLPTAESTFESCRTSWPAFWKSGGAIDFSGSADPRAPELERRVVLSQYLMAVNEAGTYPPQESGLVNNGWFGRFHLEMVWWHAAHWSLWNRWTPLERLRSFYRGLLPKAKALAKKQGYRGARWPKCIGPDGREWPFTIHSFLIWQQPHPIWFAESDYRKHPTPETLKKWSSVVEATADFLASYAFLDPKTHYYVLGPPLQVVSENVDTATTQNPTFELGYWRFGLRTAQEWRKRMGLPPKPEWQKILEGLAPLPVQDGLYVLHEGVRDQWTKFNFEHPALTGVYGMLPGDGVDVPTMRRTLDKIKSTWNFDRTWGWDFPMLAMCAARVGEPERAVDLLLDPSGGFQFDERGLATGGPFPYFPSNGALLYAISMMSAGWDGAPKTHAPGFPANGQWKVRWENLNVAP